MRARERWIRWGAALLVLVLGVALTEVVVWQYSTTREAEAVDAAQATGELVHQRLENGASSTYFLTHILDAYIRDVTLLNYGGEMDGKQIQAFLAGLREHSQYLRSIAVAPGNRITYIEPVAGNEAAVGLYYPDLPEQWPAIQSIIEGGKEALVGPIDLVQGGRGLAYRLPVFLPDGTYWGMVSTVMDADAYLADATAVPGAESLTLGLSSRDPQSGQSTVIWGDPEAFAEGAVLFDVNPLGADWELAVVPATTAGFTVTWLRALGYAVALLLAVLVFLLVGARQRRREDASRLSSLAGQVPGMLFQLRVASDGSMSVPYSSDGVREMFGITPAQIHDDATPMWDRVAPPDVAEVRAELQSSITKGRPWHQRLRMRDVHDRDHWYVIEATPEQTDDGTVLHGFLTSIDEEVANEDRLRISASVFESTRDGVVIMDDHRRIVDVNPGFTALTGFELEDVRGRTLEMLAGDLTPPAVYADLTMALERHAFWRGELVNRMKDGRVSSQAAAVSAVSGPDDELSHYVAVFSSLNAMRDDVVTGLPRRQVVEDRLAQAVERARATRSQIALLVLGLDGFRDVNETLGHRAGDLVLKETATRIRARVPEPETVSRMGADEFAIVLTVDADTARVESVAQSVLEAIAQPITVAGKDVHLTASMGVSVFPGDSDSAASLLTNANQAMRVAKDQGRGRYRFFTAAMQAEALERSQLTDDLRRAVAEGQLSLAIQPVVDLATGRIVKGEALMRWTHPERGPIGPASFIPIAEKSGLIIVMGDWLFTEVLAELRRLREVQPSFELSYNLSPVEVSDDHGLIERRLEALRHARVPGVALVAEITEGLLLDRSEVPTRNLKALRDAGVQFAIDDFGTGYSSLAYLQELDVDYVKIDRSFVNDLGIKAGSLALCEAIIDMAHRLGLRVIAEGVETEPQRDLLARAGCDLGQGYLFSRPIPADEFLAVLTAQE